MLLEQTLEQLTAMQLHGMVAGLPEWQAHPPTQPLTPADLIGLLADAEWVSRENRKLTTRLKAAKLKLPACVEDVDYRHARRLTPPPPPPPQGPGPRPAPLRARSARRGRTQGAPRGLGGSVRPRGHDHH